MSTPEMAGLALMRSPFPENQISKLPQPTKGREDMAKIQKSFCSVCNSYHAVSNVIHLDYVGHAAITSRLLDADPNWHWEPMAFGPDGLPQLDKGMGLWIRLTVCGVTRIGYGDAPGKSGGNAVKEAIGDALRNAAMRFGAALDLWHKGDLYVEEEPEQASLADEWIAKAKAATNSDELGEVWKAGVSALNAVKDMKGYGYFKDAVSAHGLALTAANGGAK